MRSYDPSIRIMRGDVNSCEDPCAVVMIDVLRRSVGWLELVWKGNPMIIRVGNIFEKLAGLPGQEGVLTLFRNQGLTIERIVSHFHSSPPGFWYDQAGDEWVIVLRGRAILEFESGERIEMKDGNYLTIPSHVRHRVQQTDSDTIWLAVHSKNTGGA